MKFLFLMFFAAMQVHAGTTDPSIEFRVLTSPHFEIIYRKEQKELAKRYALAAEQARELLMPVFKEGPEHTIIYLQDDTDQSNGLADFLPYPHITVYPVLPSSIDSVDEYGDWAFEMILHEYTHILNMYPAHGIYRPFKYIFGTVIRPNAVLPRWYLEGLAVNLETWFSDHGRLRSTETSASARALTLSGGFQKEDVASINESSLRTWPYGSRPYLYGAWWWDQVSRDHGLPVIETWNQNFSRRLPFLLNGPVFEQTQKSPNELLSVTARALESQSQQQIDAINAAGPSTGTLIAEASGEQSIFAISPSGDKLIYGNSVPVTGGEVRLKVRAQKNQPFQDIKSERLFKHIGLLRLSWLNENSFVFDKIDPSNPYATYRDLYIYDLDKRETKRLTRNLRAQDPSPSPDGQKIAFVQNDGGRDSLAIYDLATGKTHTLLIGNLFQRISGPEFLNDGEVLFSLRQRSGVEKLYSYSLNFKKARVWNDQLSSAQNVRVTREGVLVTDASTHARNVWRVHNGRPIALSNTLTDIVNADYDPQRREILVSELSAEGRRLKSIPLAEYHPPQLQIPTWPPPPKPTLTKVSVSDESYQPLEYLAPHYWIPFIYQVESGLIFQGLTANQDPAGRNQYTLLGAYDTVTKKPSYGITYTNSSTPTDINLAYAKSISYLSASGLIVESQNAALSLAPNWPFRSRFMKWSLGGVWNTTEQRSGDLKRMGPEVSWQYSRLESPLNERWGFQVKLAHTDYLPQSNYLDYQRSYAHFATQYNMSGLKRIFFQARGALAPQQPSSTIITMGDRTVGGNYLVNLANSDFLMRGYPSANFVGRKIINANLEFVFPLRDLDRGFGTFPLFLRNLDWAFFTDTVAVDGGALLKSDSKYHLSTLSENYVGAGSELRFNTTSFYHLPLTFTVGLYYGFNDRVGGGLSPFFGFGFGGLNPLEDHKTP
jgi:hypothetical protein